MAHWKRYVKKDSKFLSHCDITDRSPLQVKIEGVCMQVAHNPEDHTDSELLCLKLAGEKPFGLNNTNGLIIEKTLGTPEVTEWTGKSITLRTATCRGDECIRVDAPKGIKFPAHYPFFKYTD